MAEAPIIDLYSGMDHKAGMAGKSTDLDAAPKFLDARARRRLNFYARVRAYIETVSRYYVSPDPDNPRYQAEARDYGDLGVLIAQMSSAVLGEGLVIGVDGADEPIADEPDLGTIPKPPPDDTDPALRPILDVAFEARMQRWALRAERELAAWLEQVDNIDAMEARQTWLRRWAKLEQLIGKVHQAETESIVPLGDGVYVIGWDARSGRPRVEVLEPDAYHPVLDDADQGRYPDVVHLAWIFERTEGTRTVDYVRRITYELVLLEDLDGDAGTGPLYLLPGEEWTHVCLHSDGVWPLDAFKDLGGMGGSVEWRTITTADGETVELNRHPTGLDFIPVVHVPNLITNEHFGRSPVPRLTQLVDELIATDTDSALASRWAARPPVVVSGLGPPRADGSPRTLDMTPGKGISVEDGGAISTVEMAPNMAEIGHRTDRLLKRLSVNGRVPEGVMGRIDASEVPSGVALTMSFTPFVQLIEAMRQARDEKYALMCKMVQRVAIQAADPTLDGDVTVWPARLRFGTYMPQDLAEWSQILGTLRAAKLVSQETGLRILQANGVPADDLGAELASIRRFDMTEEADRVTGALENPRYAAELMGIDDYEGPRDGLDPDARVAPPRGSTFPPDTESDG